MIYGRGPRNEASHARLSLRRTRCSLFWTLCFSPSLGRGRGKAHGVKAGGLEGLFVPGDRNWGGAGPLEPAVPWGHVIQGKFPALPSNLSEPVSETGLVLPPRTPAATPSISLCCLWARLPRPPILLGDHFTRGLSSSIWAGTRTPAQRVMGTKPGELEPAPCTW